VVEFVQLWDLVVFKKLILGSGKSSFLVYITQRIDSGKLGGTQYFDNKPLTKQLFKEIGAYVMQDDNLLPTSTVHETLMEAAYVLIIFIISCV
jgi:ABC-type multidrug transport system ATPase subunit